jgi:co-chaperonin GroES (HSP10)
MTPRPTNDLVLLRVLESEVQYKPVDPRNARELHPIELIVSTADKLYKRAEVVAVGPGRRHPRTDAVLPMSIAVGEQVVYEDWRVKWHSGTGVWPGPGDLALVREHAIVAVVEAQCWLEWPRTYGAETPAVPEGAFDPRESGLSFNRGRMDAALRRVS